jgi:hypothetical protein
MNLTSLFEQLPEDVQVNITEQAVRADRDLHDHLLYLVQCGCVGEQMRVLDDTMRMVMGLAPRRYPFPLSIEERLADLELSSHSLVQNRHNSSFISTESPSMVRQWRLIRTNLKRLFG